MAVARKLVVIAWHMLTNNEPYRYAQSLATEGKLQRLRIKATGAKRKTGPTKGTKAGPKLAPGVRSRTVKPLAQVYAEEGLPTPSTPPPGEARTLAQSATTDYAAALKQPQVRAQRARAQARGADACADGSPGILPRDAASCGGIF